MVAGIETRACASFRDGPLKASVPKHSKEMVGHSYSQYFGVAVHLSERAVSE